MKRPKYFKLEDLTLDSRLQERVSMKTTQILARHSDIKLTMNIYTHIGLEEQMNAIHSLLGVPAMKK